MQVLDFKGKTGTLGRAGRSLIGALGRLYGGPTSGRVTPLGRAGKASRNGEGGKA
jgi:hypothetical protein